MTKNGVENDSLWSDADMNASHVPLFESYIAAIEATDARVVAPKLHG